MMAYNTVPKAKQLSDVSVAKTSLKLARDLRLGFPIPEPWNVNLRLTSLNSTAADVVFAIACLWPSNDVELRKAFLDPAINLQQQEPRFWIS